MAASGHQTRKHKGKDPGNNSPAQKKHETFGQAAMKTDQGLSHVTQQNQHESPLLRIAAELRNEIYGYVLCNKNWEIEHGGRAANKEKNALSVLGTCRQIHAEACMLPFKLSRFTFKTPDAYKSFLRLTTVDKQDAIRTIQIPYNIECREDEDFETYLIQNDAWYKTSLEFRRLSALTRVHLNGTYCVLESLDDEDNEEMAKKRIRKVTKRIETRRPELKVTWSMEKDIRTKKKGRRIWKYNGTRILRK